jgi:hypothetical protein
MHNMGQETTSTLLKVAELFMKDNTRNKFIHFLSYFFCAFVYMFVYQRERERPGDRKRKGK